MLIRSVTSFHWPNFWSQSPTFAACIDLADLKDATSTSLSGFAERLLAFLPTLGDGQRRDGRSNDFAAQLQAGVGTADVLNRVFAELQSIACVKLLDVVGMRADREPGVVHIACQFEEEEVARACLDEAVAIVSAAAAGTAYDAPAAIERLRSLANAICLGPTTGAIVGAAMRRGIPARRLDDNSLVQLGHGCKQRRIRMAVTSETRAIAQDIAQDKGVTNSLLRAMGLPVPEGRIVTSADDAWQAAQEIGVPVVVKPRNANHGRGVAVNLSTRELIEQAYEAAVPEGDGVLVETFAQGSEHRLLVVDGRLVAASRGEPELVVGDGRQTVRELVEEVNRDPRRGDDWAAPLCKIELDPPAALMLAKQGYDFDSIPPKKKQVLIHHNGEFLTDVTRDVHPETAAVAELAARVVGLNIAGIDLIVTDITKPLRAQGGKIVEVNAGPGLRMHFEPQYGDPQPVDDIIIASLFDSGDNGRIPLVAVAGSEGRTDTTRLMAHLLAGRRPHIGLSDARGLQVGGRELYCRTRCGATPIRTLLLHPDTDAAVVEIAPKTFLREGLGFDRCQAAVVIDIDLSPAGAAGGPASPVLPGEPERALLASLEGGGAAILNSQQPAVAALAALAGPTVILFADQAEEPAVFEHRRQGGRAVFVENGAICVADGAAAVPVVSVIDLPAAARATGPAGLRPLLAAVAAAYSLGLPTDELADRLRSYRGGGV